LQGPEPTSFADKLLVAFRRPTDAGLRPQQAAAAAVSVRHAHADDDAALLRLAGLDSAAPLEPPMLVAEVSGELLAALSLRGQRVVADPCHVTADLGELLRVRAAQLAAADEQG